MAPSKKSSSRSSRAAAGSSASASGAGSSSSSSNNNRTINVSINRGSSVALPPELAAEYLRSAYAVQSSNGNRNSGAAGANASSTSSNSSTSPRNNSRDEAEMKALMSMFVEIMGMSSSSSQAAGAAGSAGAGTNHHGNTSNRRSFVRGGGSSSTATATPVFSFSRKTTSAKGGGRASTTTTTSSTTSSAMPWPPSAAAAAAAAAAGLFSSSNKDDDDDDDEWTLDYYCDESENYATKDHGDAQARRKGGERATENVDETARPAAKKAKRGNQSTAVAAVAVASTTDTSTTAPATTTSAPTTAHSHVGAAEPSITPPNNNDDDDDDNTSNAIQGASSTTTSTSRAAKKRERKLRKKARAKEEAALKAHEAEQKRRYKQIQSWKSRVVDAVVGAANSNGNGSPSPQASTTVDQHYKLQGLLSESPLGKLNNSNTTADDNDNGEYEDCVSAHLESLLPHCIAKSCAPSKLIDKDGSNSSNDSSACQKLATYIVNMSVSVVFTIANKTERNALHTACLVGDCFFVQLVVDKHAETSDNENDSSDLAALDLLCRDSGWTALQYAVASACPEAMELLLEAGCHVSKRTDESLTCRASNGEGLTAREFAEILSAGKKNGLEGSEIETQGTALQEALEQRSTSNRADKQRYLRVLKAMATRLKDVEENGYSSPPSRLQTDSLQAEYDQDAVAQERNVSTGDDAKKRKKKKKRQKQSESNNGTVNDSPAAVEHTQASVATPTAHETVDPLITALLGMGFTAEQIHEAAKACGGLDRATADQMVMCILNGGEESHDTPPPPPTASSASPGEPNDISAAAEAAFVPTTGRSNSKSGQSAKPAQQPAANMKRAQQQNVKAAKREEETRAVAERAAAKREEQRRRNREWNNRAQARQQEEIEQVAQDEAKRVVLERVAAKRQAASHAVLAGKGNVKQTRTRPAQQPPAPIQILQRPSNMPVGGIPAGMVSSSAAATGPTHPSSYAAPPAGMETNAVMGYSHQGQEEYEGMSHHVSSGNSVSSAGSGSPYGYATAPHVSSGNSVSSGGSGKPVMSHYVSSGNSVSSGGSGMQNAGMLYQGQQSMYGHPPATSVPPPGFHAFGGAPAVSTGSSSMSISEDTAVSFEESSASGEIRATARAFVPTGFKPTPSSTATISTASTSASASVPPGMGLPPVVQESLAGSPQNGPLASLLSATGPGTKAPSTSEASSGEPLLNSVMGFGLQRSGNSSSLLGSLSASTADGSIEESLATGTNIWGSTSLAPVASSSLTGFDIASSVAPKTGDAAAVGSVGNSGMWAKSGLNQGGSSGLGSIW